MTERLYETIFADFAARKDVVDIAGLAFPFSYYLLSDLQKKSLILTWYSVGS